MESSREELASLASGGEELSQTPPYSMQCTATLPPPSPQEETCLHADMRLQHFDLLARYRSATQVTQSNPNLLANKEAHGGILPHHTNQWVDAFQGHGIASESIGRGWLCFRFMHLNIVS